MSKDFLKRITPYILSGFIWIIFDLLFFYFRNNYFSAEELKNITKPVIAGLAMVSVFFILRSKVRK